MNRYKPNYIILKGGSSRPEISPELFAPPELTKIEELTVKIDVLQALITEIVPKIRDDLKTLDNNINQLKKDNNLK